MNTNLINLFSMIEGNTNLKAEMQTIANTIGADQLSQCYTTIKNFMLSDLFSGFNNIPDNFNPKLKEIYIDTYLQATLKNSWNLRGQFIDIMVNIASFSDVFSISAGARGIKLSLSIIRSNDSNILDPNDINVDLDFDKYEELRNNQIEGSYKVVPSSLDKLLLLFEKSFVKALLKGGVIYPTNFIQYITKSLYNNNAYFSLESVISVGEQGLNTSNKRQFPESNKTVFLDIQTDGVISDYFLKLYIPVIAELMKQSFVDKLLTLQHGEQDKTYAMRIEALNNDGFDYSSISGLNISSLPKPDSTTSLTGDYLYKLTEQHNPFKSNTTSTTFSYKPTEWNKWKVEVGMQSITIILDKNNNQYSDSLKFVDGILNSYISKGINAPDVILVGETSIISKFSDNKEKIEKVFNVSSNLWQDFVSLLPDIKNITSIPEGPLKGNLVISRFDKLIKRITSLYIDKEHISHLDLLDITNKTTDFLTYYSAGTSSDNIKILSDFNNSLKNIYEQLILNRDNQGVIDLGINIANIPSIDYSLFNNHYKGKYVSIGTLPGWLLANKGNRKDVAVWAGLPTVDLNGLPERPSAYDIDAYIVLENDKTILTGTAKLISKSMSNSIVIYLNIDGQTRIAYQPPGVDLLAPGRKIDNIRLTIRGHGNRGQSNDRYNTTSLSRYTPIKLANLLYSHILTNPVFKNISTPSVINLTPCMLAQNAEFSSFGGYFTVIWGMMTGQFNTSVIARSGLNTILSTTNKATVINIVELVGAAAAMSNSVNMKYTFRLSPDGTMTVSARAPTSRQKPTMLLNINGKLIELWNDPDNYGVAPDDGATYHLFIDDIGSDIRTLNKDSYEHRGEMVCKSLYENVFNNRMILINNVSYKAEDLYTAGILIDDDIVRPYRVDKIIGNVTLDRVKTFNAFMDFNDTPVTSTPVAIGELKKLISPINVNSGVVYSNPLYLGSVPNTVKKPRPDITPFPELILNDIIDKSVSIPNPVTQAFDRHLIIELSDNYHNLALSLFKDSPQQSEWIKLGDNGEWVSAHSIIDNLTSRASLTIGECNYSKITSRVKMTILGMDNIDDVNHYIVKDLITQLDTTFGKLSGHSIDNIYMEFIGRQIDSNILSGLKDNLNLYLNEKSVALGIDNTKLNLDIKSYFIGTSSSVDPLIFNSISGNWENDAGLVASTLLEQVKLVNTEREKYPDSDASVKIETLQKLQSAIEKTAGNSHDSDFYANVTSGEKLSVDDLTIISDLPDDISPAYKPEEQMAFDLVKVLNQAEQWNVAAENLLSHNGMADAGWKVTTQIRPSESGQTQILTINEVQNKIKWLDTSAVIFNEFYESINEYRNKYTGSFDVVNDQPVVKKNVTEAEATHTLNAAFTLQSLMQINQLGQMSTAVKIQFYTGLVQGGLSLLTDDAAQIFILVKSALAKDVYLASKVFTLFKNISGGIGLLSNGLILGAQIWQLVENRDQYAVPGIALNIVSSTAGLILGISGMVVSSAVFSAVAGGAGVILAGLGIGFSALADALSAPVKQFDAIQKHFDKLLEDVNTSDIYQKVTSDGFTYYSPKASAVIKSIDFHSGTNTLGDVYINGTKGGTGHTRTGGWDHYFSSPDIDYKNYYNFYENLDVKNTVFKFDNSASTLPLVLPFSPSVTYKITTYNLVTGARYKNPVAFERLRNNLGTGFVWGYWASVDRAITEVESKIQSTSVDIYLDKAERIFLVPTFDGTINKYFNYHFYGNSGKSTIVLSNTPVNISCQFGSNDDNFCIDISSAIKTSSVVNDKIVYGDIKSDAFNSLKLSSDNRLSIAGNTITFNSKYQTLNADKTPYIPIEGVSVQYTFDDIIAIVQFNSGKKNITFISKKSSQADLKVIVSKISAHINKFSSSLGIDPKNKFSVICDKYSGIFINGTLYISSQITSGSTLIKVSDKDFKQLTFTADVSWSIKTDYILGTIPVKSGVAQFDGTMVNDSLTISSIILDDGGSLSLQKYLVTAAKKDLTTIINWLKLEVTSSSGLTKTINYSSDLIVSALDQDGNNIMYNFSGKNIAQTVTWDKFDTNFYLDGQKNMLVVSTFLNNDIISLGTSQSNPNLTYTNADTSFLITPSLKVKQIIIEEVKNNLFIPASSTTKHGLVICLPGSIKDYNYNKEGSDLILVNSLTNKKIHLAEALNYINNGMAINFSKGREYLVKEIFNTFVNSLREYIGSDLSGTHYYFNYPDKSISNSINNNYIYPPITSIRSAEIINNKICFIDESGYIYQRQDDLSFRVIALRDTLFTSVSFPDQSSFYLPNDFKFEALASVFYDTSSSKLYLVGLSGGIYTNNGPYSSYMPGLLKGGKFISIQDADRISGYEFRTYAGSKDELYIHVPSLSSYDRIYIVRKISETSYKLVSLPSGAFISQKLSLVGYKGASLIVIPGSNPYGERFELRNGEAYLDEYRHNIADGLDPLSRIQRVVTSHAADGIKIDTQRGVRVVIPNKKTEIYISGNAFSTITPSMRGARTYNS